jgi:hypothetical protein
MSHDGGGYMGVRVLVKERFCRRIIESAMEVANSRLIKGNKNI